MKTVLVLLFAIAAAAGAQTPAVPPAAVNTFEMYSVAYTDPAAAAEVVRKIAGADGNVVYDEKNRRLLVLATPDEHAQIAGIMAQINVRPKNVRIDVNFLGTRRDTDREASVTGHGGVVVTKEGSKVNYKIQPRVIDMSSEGKSNVRQTLLVMSGREAYLNVGEQVPYLEWLMDYGLHHGYVRERVQWQHVGSRLVVEPTVIGQGPEIRIRITPELSGIVNGQAMHTRYANAATEVYVQDGQTITIGGNNQNRDFYNRFLGLGGIGAAGGSRVENLSITLTPHIQ